MKTEIFKKLIKEAVKEAIHEELKDILLESIKGNKKPINESNDIKSFNFTTNSIPHQPQQTNYNTKQAYMDILKETAEGPKSGFAGEFKPVGPIDSMNGALPEGQLGIDQILGLIKK